MFFLHLFYSISSKGLIKSRKNMQCYPKEDNDETHLFANSKMVGNHNFQ